VTDQELETIREKVTELRRRIDDAKAAHPDEHVYWVTSFPYGCCDGPYVWLLLYEMGFRGMMRRTANVRHLNPTDDPNSFNLHVWIVLDGVTIDITADQFGDDIPRVMVERSSPWHEALPLTKPDSVWADDGNEAAFYDEFFDRDNDRYDFYLVYDHVLNAPSLSGQWP
jgi:hypothetical protein